MLCIRGFNYQAPHKEHACFPIIPPPKSCQTNVFFKHCVHILGKSPHFSYKSGLSLGLLCWGYLVKFRLFPHKSPAQNRIYYCCVPLNQCIKLKFYAFCVFAVANYVFCGIFIPNVKFHATCNVQHLCSIINVFCFKRTPICLLWCSLKAIFSSFVPHHVLLHVSCILLVSKFNANKQNKLTNVNFLRHYTKFIKMCLMCLKMPNLVKTLNLFFLQYDVLLRTPSLLFRA